MDRVALERLDYPGDGLYYRHGEPFSGVAVCMADAGWVESEAEYRKGLLSGVKKEWYGPGLLWREARCAWGARHGLYREWHENGSLAAEAQYEYGVRVSGRRWDEHGGLMEDFHIQESDPAFQILLAVRSAQWAASEAGDSRG